VEVKGAISFPNRAAAVSTAQEVGCPPEFAELMWAKAAGRGGCDASDVPIRNWPAYLTVEWAYEKELRQLASLQGGDHTPNRARLQAAEAQLQNVTGKIKALPRYSSSVFPEKCAEVEKERAPPVAERERLAKLIDGMRKQLSADGGAA
jgi:predicted phage gp36 major capsid-like protein